MSARVETVRQAWQTVLEVPAVADGDDFFDLGGHSLKAMELTYRLKSEFGVKIPVRLLFSERQFSAFAKAVDQRVEDSALAGDR